MEWLDSIVLTMFTMMGPGGNEQSPQGGGMSFLIPMIIIFAIFYFLLIRPQSKKQKEHQQTLNELKKGDRVITTGGIYGIIVGIEEQTLQVKIADKVKIQLSRSAVSGLAKTEEQTKA